MTPEAQRIAIAEACGWRTKRSVTFDPSGTILPFSGPPAYPDYLNDLNAMHEAEKMLKTVDNYDTRIYTRSTAVEHAQAFLKVIGKWDDSK
jgi:hypothetical protein